MTGLDKILCQIKSEADVKSADIIEKAQAQADEILAEARKQAQMQCDSISKRSDIEAADALARAKSAAALYKRKSILDEKQKIIAETIAMAKEKLYSLSSEQYFNIILKMAARYALPQEGEIIFSQADLNRLPDNFEATLNETINHNNAKLTISRQASRIDGGFVLVYGGVEENCSFTALFDSAHEALQDKVHELLF